VNGPQYTQKSQKRWSVAIIERLPQSPDGKGLALSGLGRDRTGNFLQVKKFGQLFNNPDPPPKNWRRGVLLRE